VGKYAGEQGRDVPVLSGIFRLYTPQTLVVGASVMAQETTAASFLLYWVEISLAKVPEADHSEIAWLCCKKATVYGILRVSLRSTSYAPNR
jgi:hypothetical protein